MIPLSLSQRPHAREAALLRIGKARESAGVGQEAVGRGRGGVDGHGRKLMVELRGVEGPRHRGLPRGGQLAVG